MSIVSIILLFGIAQGVFLAVLIFHKHSGLVANRFLGVLMIVYALCILHILLGEVGYYLNNPRIMLLLMGIIFLLGPMHFLYARFLMDPARTPGILDGMHFIPFLLYLLFILPVLLNVENVTTLVEQEYFGTDPPDLFYVLNWLFLIQLMVYMVVVLRLLRTHTAKMKIHFSNLEKVKLLWLRNITYMAGSVSLIFLLENLLVLNDTLNTNYIVSSIMTGVYVYSMGYMGISKSEVFSKEIETTIPGKNGNSVKDKKYKRSGLSEEKADDYLEQLVKLMEEDRLFTNSTLTLKDLSNQLSISTHHISETINSKLDQNFFDFVNQYRVNQVIQDMGNSEKKHLTLLGIALDAGFNSKSSFNTIFKNQVGTTPSEYRRRLATANS